jgi:hypothetical protein
MLKELLENQPTELILVLVLCGTGMAFSLLIVLVALIIKLVSDFKEKED